MSLEIWPCLPFLSNVKDATRDLAPLAKPACCALITAIGDPGCRKDLDFFASLTVDGHSDKDVKQRLQLVAESGFRRVSYTEAIEILQKALQDFRPSRKGEKLFPNTDVEVSLRWSEPKGVSSPHIGWLSWNSLGVFDALVVRLCLVSQDRQPAAGTAGHT